MEVCGRRCGHAVPGEHEQPERDGARDRQGSQPWHQASGADRDEGGHQQRAGERADLVQRLVHPETASHPDLAGGVREQCGLRRAAHRLADALRDDEDGSHGEPGGAE